MQSSNNADHCRLPEQNQNQQDTIQHLAAEKAKPLHGDKGDVSKFKMDDQSLDRSANYPIGKSSDAVSDSGESADSEGFIAISDVDDDYDPSSMQLVPYTGLTMQHRFLSAVSLLAQSAGETSSAAIEVASTSLNTAYTLTQNAASTAVPIIAENANTVYLVAAPVIRSYALAAANRTSEFAITNAPVVKKYAVAAATLTAEYAGHAAHMAGDALHDYAKKSRGNL